MRQVAKRLYVVLAILVAMLAAGRGLPGLVEALHGPVAHVCTCATGGDHATCPVCNPSLTAPGRPHSQAAPAAQGVPCGDPRVAVGVPGEVSTLPSPLVAVAPASAWARAPRAQSPPVEQIRPEPATPPPRSVAT
jgi:hypothetical protein